MAGRTLFLGDPHLGSENTAKWRGFESVEEHDDSVMDSILDQVMSRDTLVLAGDIDWRGGEHFDECFERACIKKFGGVINLTIRVVMGNHDKYSSLLKSKYIVSYHGCLEYGGSDHKIVVTHIPVHPDCLDRWVVNINGHLHENLINDSRFINCSWEQNRAPILLSDIITRVTTFMKSNPRFLKSQVIGGLVFKRDYRNLKFYKFVYAGTDKSGKLRLVTYQFSHIYNREATFESENGTDGYFTTSIDGYMKILPDGIYTDKLRAARHLLHEELLNLEETSSGPTPISEEEAEFNKWCNRRSKYLVRKVLELYPDLNS